MALEWASGAQCAASGGSGPVSTIMAQGFVAYVKDKGKEQTAWTISHWGRAVSAAVQGSHSLIKDFIPLSQHLVLVGRLCGQRS